MKCFIDTNTFIHYRSFVDVDWVNIISSPNVELVICPAVLHELDHKKFAELDIDIRNRCKRIIAKLTDFQSNPLISDNVEIVFLTNEPNIEWAIKGLSPDIPDDRIIASIIEGGEWEDTILISSDLGLKLKAHSHNIKTLTLPEDLLVQVKKDRKDEELVKLQKKIASLENQLPILDLKIADNNSFSNFMKYSFNKIKPYDQKFEDDTINELKEELKYIPPRITESPINSALAPLLSPSDTEITRYENSVTIYLNNMRDYYKSEWDYKDRQSRTFEINLILKNDGSAPANDIDIFLHFPDGFVMCRKDELTHSPKCPEKPEKPRRLADEMFSYIASEITIPNNFLRPHNYANYSQTINKSINTSPSIKRTNSYEVKFKIDKLKHKMNIKLDPLYIYFDNYESINSFSFDYRILAGNNPDDFKAKLNIIFS